MKIVVDPKKCSGCRLCEIFCSLAHEEKINPRKARLRAIRRIYPKFEINIIVCRQCENPPCQNVCPTDAIRECVESGILVIDEETCTGCMACVDECPFGALFIDPDKLFPLKCDLCSGAPVCVRNCPTEALTFISEHQASQVKNPSG